MNKEKAEYSVISANIGTEAPHAASRDTKAMIAGCTASGAEVAQAAGAAPPYQNKYNHPDYENIRKKGVVEKCIFCEHRVKQGLKPYCVEVCPAQARIFGDLNDPTSEPAKLLKKYKPMRLKEEKKTKPNVAYIRAFKGENKV